MVSLIVMHIEGGGPTRKTQTPLREGFDTFCGALKEQAEQRGVRLRFNLTGSRDQACQDFQTALQTHPDAWNVLLVDAESEVTTKPKAHLQQRDGWDLSKPEEGQIHLMAQCMEAWLVSDPEAMGLYYGQRFNARALPRRQNLEEEPKAQIYASLDSATRQTQKGAYAKIKLASELLKRVSQEKAKARCPHCRRFFDTVAARLNQGNQ